MVKFAKYSVICSATALLLFTGCGDVGYEGENRALTFEDVRIVSVSEEPSIELSATLNQGILASSSNAGLQPDNPNYKTAFGIKSYKIIYTTTNEDGSDINASGLISIPIPTDEFLATLKAKGKTYSMSIVSDQHGTIFEDKDAPSSSIGGLPKFLAAIQRREPPESTPMPFLISAVSGFITVQPDYIGYGASKGLHPYLLEKSSASATIDLIKATVKFASDKKYPFNGQVFLSGYSEGAYVTLAAAKEIEANHPNINLMAIAPMAGPYDLNATGMGLMAPDINTTTGILDFDTTMGRPDFIGGIINSYASVYDFDLTKILNAPYATILPTLYDGNNSEEYIRSKLDKNITEFFVHKYRLDFLENPNNPLKQAFIENTPLDWAPKTKVKLLHCTNDEVISSQLSQIADARFKANGSTSIDLDLITENPPIENTDGTFKSAHESCGILTYPKALEWFSKIRMGEIKWKRLYY